MECKKIFILLIFSAFILVSCLPAENSVNVNDEYGLIEKVETLEKNRLDVFTQKISVPEYKENIEGIFVNAIEEKNFAMIEDELDQDRLLEYADYIENGGYEMGRIDRTFLHILCQDSIEGQFSVASKITDGTFEGEKRVGVKKEMKFYFQDELVLEEIVFRIFNFKNIDGHWKVTEVREKIESITDLDTAEKEDIILNMPFNLSNKDNIEYVNFLNIK